MFLFKKYKALYQRGVEGSMSGGEFVWGDSHEKSARAFGNGWENDFPARG